MIRVGVGKSALVVQFCKGKFVERFDPTIEDAYRQQAEVDGQAHMVSKTTPRKYKDNAQHTNSNTNTVTKHKHTHTHTHAAIFWSIVLTLLQLEIYDTAGQEEFSSLRDTYIKASEGFLLVYSTTAIRTFQHVRLQTPVVYNHFSINFPQAQKLLTHIHKMKSVDVPVVLIGNKKDMEDQREVPTADASTFASTAGIAFMGERLLFVQQLTCCKVYLLFVDCLLLLFRNLR
jgi:Ras-related protein Rap-2C